MIIAFSCIVATYTIKYLNIKKRYGTVNNRLLYRKMQKNKIIPNRENKRYKETKMLLVHTGWNISVEFFYILKYLVAFLVLVGSFIFVNANLGLQEGVIIEDLNYKRPSGQQIIEPNKDLIEEEKKTLKKVEEYLKTINSTTLDDNITIASVEAYLKGENIVYEGSEVLAKRLVLKLNTLNQIQNNPGIYIRVILITILSFFIPNLMGAVKIKVISSKRDWDILTMLTSYSITGRIPPYKIEKVIENMQEVTTLFRYQLQSFKEVLQADKKEEIKDKELNEFISSTVDEDLSEIFETLILAKEGGIKETIGNVDDKIESNIKWIEVKSRQARGVKVVFCIIPVFILMLLLFDYLMYGMTALNQGMIIDLQ